MVLVLDGKPQNNSPESIKTLCKDFPMYKTTSNEFLSKGTKQVSSRGLLYVGQREFATSIPQDKNVTIIGSDDATTCIIVVVRHSGSGATALAHFDGSGFIQFK